MVIYEKGLKDVVCQIMSDLEAIRASYMFDWVKLHLRCLTGFQCNTTDLMKWYSRELIRQNQRWWWNILLKKAFCIYILHEQVLRALSSFNIFIELLFKGVVFKLFFTSLVSSSFFFFDLPLLPREYLSPSFLNNSSFFWFSPPHPLKKYLTPPFLPSIILPNLECSCADCFG